GIRDYKVTGVQTCALPICIRQITARTVDFGATDGPMTDEQLKAAPGELFHVPTVVGAVVATYNLPGNPKLRFTPEILADIFFGKIGRASCRERVEIWRVSV